MIRLRRGKRLLHFNVLGLIKMSSIGAVSSGIAQAMMKSPAGAPPEKSPVDNDGDKDGGKAAPPSSSNGKRLNMSV